MTDYKINKIFSNNLNRLLNTYKKNQYELAEYIGVSNQTITNYVKGYNSPRMDKVDKIAEFFGVSRNELLVEEETSIIPTEFTTAKEAMEFMLNQAVVMGFNGLDVTKLTEEEQLQYANDMLEMMKLVSLKYKDKK